MADKLTHSYSSIKMFEQCPKRYLHQRINKDVVDKGSEATIYGERIHKQLENRLALSEPLPKESAKYEEVCKVIGQVTKGAELHLEQQLCLNENLTPTGWYDDNAWLRSILDVLILKGDTAIIMDWKTGKRRPDFMQLELFALQTFKHYPNIKRVKSSFIWLKEGKTDNETFTIADVNVMWTSLLSKIDKIDQSYKSNTFPARPSGLCRYCPANKLCEYARI